MNTGSKMILASAPAKVEAIANLGLPSMYRAPPPEEA